MLQWIQTANSFVNNLVWGLPAIVCIIGVGLLLTLRTRFLQFRKLPYSIKATVGKLFSKEKANFTAAHNDNIHKQVLSAYICIDFVF